MRLLTIPRSALALVAGLALLGTGLLHTPAAHADEWCWGDPVISVNGQQTQILVGIGGSVSTVTAAHVVANIVVYVPAGVTTVVVTPPPTTGPFRETLTIVTQGTLRQGTTIPIRVTTTFTSTTTLAAAMQVTYHSGKPHQHNGTTHDLLWDYNGDD